MRVLGLDIGKTYIRAVELDTALGRHEIHDHHEVKVEPGQNVLAEAALLIRSLRRRPDRLAIALPSQLCTYRNFELPTKDRKAIQSGVQFELEDDLPFDLEDTAFDYSILSQVGGKTSVHIAAALKDKLKEAIQSYLDVELDPDLLTSEAWAYRTLMNRIVSKENEAPYLLLDIGEAKTHIYVHWQGTPVILRTVRWGGSSLTRALMEHYQISQDEAENAKMHHGFVLSGELYERSSSEQKEFSDCFVTAMQPLIGEIRQTLLATKSLTGANIGEAYLSGRTALLPGISQLFAEKIGVRTSGLKSLSSISTSGVHYADPTDFSFTLAAGAALCMVGSERNTAINFRKGEFSKAGTQTEINFQTLKAPLAGAAIVLLAFSASLGAENYVYRSRLDGVEDQLERSLRNFYGGITRQAVRAYLRSPERLRTSIESELKKDRELATLFETGKHSPFEFLNLASQQIPASVVVDLIKFEAGLDPSKPYEAEAPSNVEMEFLVASPTAAEKLTAEIKRFVPNASRSNIEAAKSLDQKSDRWKVSFKGKLQ